MEKSSGGKGPAKRGKGVASDKKTPVVLPTELKKELLSQEVLSRSPASVVLAPRFSPPNLKKMFKSHFTATS